MKALFQALVGVYTRWRYVEDVETPPRRVPEPVLLESSKDEVSRLRAAIARERRNLESFLRFQCGTLAGPCESSIRTMEGRLRALELMNRRAV